MMFIVDLTNVRPSIRLYMKIDSRFYSKYSCSPPKIRPRPIENLFTYLKLYCSVVFFPNTLLLYTSIVQFHLRPNNLDMGLRQFL